MTEKRMSEAPAEEPEVRMVSLEAIMQDLTYPVTTREIVDYARHEGAAGSVISYLQMLPEGAEFESEADLNLALKKIK